MMLPGTDDQSNAKRRLSMTNGQDLIVDGITSGGQQLRRSTTKRIREDKSLEAALNEFNTEGRLNELSSPKSPGTINKS